MLSDGQLEKVDTDIPLCTNQILGTFKSKYFYILAVVCICRQTTVNKIWPNLPHTALVKQTTVTLLLCIYVYLSLLMCVRLYYQLSGYQFDMRLDFQRGSWWHMIEGRSHALNDHQHLKQFQIRGYKWYLYWTKVHIYHIIQVTTCSTK